MDLLNCRILNELQDGFPLVHAPFLELGNKLGIPGEECLLRVKKMKHDGLIREIGAVFDARSLGYQSTLVAMKIDPSRIETAAAIVSRHSGVSHNYERSDDFNLWFTLAVLSGESLDDAVRELHQAAGSLGTLNLPALRVFKIGVKFLFSEDGVKAESFPPKENKPFTDSLPLAREDIEFIQKFQVEFPMVPHPYEVLAGQKGQPEDGFIDKARQMLEKGSVRRVCALIDHRKAGLSANAMAVWQVPAGKEAAVGAELALFPEVSHCYWRKTSNEWPYPIYSMIHARKVGEVNVIIGKMKSMVGGSDYRIVLGLREFKKIRMRYFSDNQTNRL